MQIAHKRILIQSSLWLLAAGPWVFAQQPPGALEPVHTARVLNSQEVDLGSRSITYQRIETPVLKPKSTVGLHSAATPPQAPAAQQSWALRERQGKPHVSLSLVCTVYDRRTSLVRWERTEGAYEFWSAIDFRFLRGFEGFETVARKYSVAAAVGEESLQDVLAWNEIVDSDPELSNYEFDLRFPVPPSPVPSKYEFIATPASGIDPEALAAIEALHGYFNTNRARLIADWHEREAERVARERWLEAHPPVPSDTVIRYFPIKSSHGNAIEEAAP